MPPINKRRKTPILGTTAAVQDYVDPMKRLVYNPKPSLVDEITEAASKKPSVGKQLRSRPTQRKIAQKVVEEGEAALKYNPMTDVEKSQFLASEAADKEAKSAAAQTDSILANSALSFTGAAPMTAGMALPLLTDDESPIWKTLDRQAIQNTRTAGRLIQAVFGSEEGSTVLGDLGKAIENFAGTAQANFQSVNRYERPKEQKSIYERGLEFLASIPDSFAKFAGASALAGPVLGFGAMRTAEAYGRGEEDYAELAKEFAFGAATGALLHGLNKTADLVGHYSNVPGIGMLAKAPKTTQATAQFLGGVAQTYGETFIAKDHDAPPDAFDYLSGGLLNVALDPVVFGNSPKAKKATDVAVESTKKWANDQLPPSGMAELRNDFWQPMDIPWPEKVTGELLKRARIQYTEAPGEPEGTLFVNPQAAVILQRIGESVDNRSAQVHPSSGGSSYTPEAAQLLSARAQAKANEIKRVIEQLPDGHEKLIPYAEAAIMYESLADHLDAASADGRPVNMRFVKSELATDPTDPKAVAHMDTVVGHESFHSQTHKIAGEVASNWAMLTDPFWLASHPFGAKVVASIGDPGNPLNGYKEEHLTGEALAYAAQPGEANIGLSKDERGILVGDYLGHLQDKYGGGILSKFYAGRLDRDVAKVAFRRLYEAGRVGYKRDANGKAIGLEWPDILPPMNWKIPGDPLGEVMQAPLSVDEERELKAPTWYSSLERFVEGKVRGSAPANQLLSVIKEGQPMPLSIEPSDTHETSPIDDISDDTADNLDETRQINVNTISTEQKERYDSLMAEQTKARNAHKDLARQLRFAKKEIDHYTELQRNSGVDHSDTIRTTRRYAEDLARRVAAAKVELNESAARTNEFRDSLVAELGENVVFGVAPDLAERAKALKRLQDIANEIPADGDLQQMVVAATKMYAFDRVMTDTLISLGPQWNPSRFPDVPLSDLFYQAVAAGKADIELFTKVLDANSLTLNEFNDISRETMRTAARLMSSKSRAKRILNKMFKADAEFQDWFDKSVPTVRELQALARGRSNIQRILHLGQSLLLVQPATMAMNAVGGGVNTGLRVYLNTFNAGLQKLLYNTRAQATYRDADFVEQPIIPSSFTEIIAPLRELWGIFGYGKELGKPIPPLQVQLAKNKNIARLQKLIEAFPEVEGKMLAPLEADVESVGTEREKQQIEIWNKQIALLPEGPKKRRLSQELVAAEKRAINEQTKISTMLRGGEAFVHKMLRLNRAQEQFFRTGIFLGQLDNYAKNQGIDLAQLESNNALSELPDDIVNRAMNDALEMTYGNRPSPKARPGSFDSLWYSTTRFMNDKLISGTLVYFPNFMVNFLRQHLELNPLTGLRLFRAMHRAEYEQGNYDAIGKSVFGAMALGAANLIRSSRYDEEEGKKNLNEVGNWPGGTEWYSVGGVDMRPTPFAPFLLMADMYQRNKRGLPQQVKTLGEISRAFGAEQRNLTGMADWLDKALSQLNDGSITNADKLKATTGSAIGEWISHFATPMQLITDLVSIFDKDQRKLKDTRGMFQGAILDPTISKIPYLRDGLPDRIDPLTGRPMVNADSFLGPVARQATGFRLIPGKSYVGQVFSANGIALKDWIPFTGIPEIDRDLVSEIAKNVNKMTERYETADIRNRPVDEQVAEMYADYKAEAVAALSDVLGTKYPELEEMMLEKQELNLWERRVEERKRRQAGLPSAEEIYRQRKQQRIERQGK